ncbi:ABC transporter substrate-binding protein [Anaerococcus sp. AGMB09787]|uniref:ABC transporter substrate-binding protein n=1 Tax=Anaerococcus sp. AGMB09787 TaxID=2922869 RepID=UPI001FB01773|nr:ABC transporter substrate-binding protein [Anaerococcus sp. AGMB09787]
MKVKKLLILGLSSILLSACSANDNDKAGQTLDSGQTASAVSNVETTSNLVSDGIIDLGTSADFPPFEFYKDQEMTGIDIDIANEISKKIGIEIKFHDMEFSAIIASIESGKLDGGMSGFTVTDERKKQVNFTDSYTKSVQKIMIKNDSEIAAIDQLKDKKIGVQLGTTGEIFAVDDFGDENVQSFAKYSDAVLALQSGKIDAMVLDQQTADKFVKANDDLKILETDYAQEDYAIALGKENQALYDEINKALNELKEDGTIDKILDKYINSED